MPETPPTASPTAVDMQHRKLAVGGSRMLRSITSICLAVLILGSAIVGGGTYSAAWAAHPGGQETVVMSESLSDVPGSSLTAVLVTYDPGGKSPKHHHAGSVYAYVVSGSIRSQNSATGSVKVYG